MKKFREIISCLLAVGLIFNVSLSNLAEGIDDGTFLIQSSESTLLSDVEANETSEMMKEMEFIEETSEGLDITDYEREVLRKIIEMEAESKSVVNEQSETDRTANSNILESIVADIVLERVGGSSEIIVEEEDSVGTNLFTAGDHPSTASPSVVINSTYDRYEIYTGENA